VLACVTRLGLGSFRVKLGRSGVRGRLVQVHLGAIWICFLRGPALGLLLVSACVLLTFEGSLLARAGTSLYVARLHPGYTLLRGRKLPIDSQV
jgi:hypothetical protein